MTFDKVRHGGIEKRMRISCYLALVALAMIAWSLVDPAPLPVIGAMSVGQAIGTGSLAFFLYAIAADLWPALKSVRARAEEPTEVHEAPESQRSSPEKKG